MKLTVANVRDCLERVREIRGDPEMAHGLQDELFREVLTVIASGDVGLPAARRIASEALKVDEIDFARWMA